MPRTAKPRRRTGAAGWPTLLVSLIVVALLAPAAPTAEASRAVAVQSSVDLPRTAALVPETVPAYVSLDLDTASPQWGQARSLLERAGFPGGADTLLGFVLGALGGERKQPAGADPFLGGEVAWIFDRFPSLAATLPVVAPAATDATPPAEPPSAFSAAATILHAGDPDAAWFVAADRLEKRAAATGAVVSETTYRGVPIRSRPAVPGTAGEAIARVDDLLLFADDPSGLEGILDTAAGAAPALRDAPVFVETRARLPPDALLFAFADNARLNRSSGADWIEGVKIFFPKLVAEMDGIDRVAPPDVLGGETGVALWADAPGFRLDVAASSPVDADPTYAPPPNVDMVLDERVPADTLFFFAGKGTETRSLFAGLMPSIAVGLNAWLGPDPSTATPDVDRPLEIADLPAEITAANERLGFDLHADLVNELFGEFALSASVSPLLAGNGGVSAIAASDVGDEARVRVTLDRVAALVRKRAETMEVTSRSVGTDVVFVARDPRSPGMPAIEFGIVGGQLLAGVGSGIDDYVAGPAAPLAADERYRRVMATLPAEHYQVSYVNVGEAIDLIDLVLAALGRANADPSATPGPGLGERVGGIEAFAQVAYQEEGINRLSAILYIGPG